MQSTFWYARGATKGPTFGFARRPCLAKSREKKHSRSKAATAVAANCNFRGPQERYVSSGRDTYADEGASRRRPGSSARLFRPLLMLMVREQRQPPTGAFFLSSLSSQVVCVKSANLAAPATITRVAFIENSKSPNISPGIARLIALGGPSKLASNLTSSASFISRLEPNGGKKNNEGEHSKWKKFASKLSA